MEPADLHRRVEAGINAGDVDALTALYENDARMVGPDGTVLHGVDEIRSLWQQGVDVGIRISMTTTYAIESGDLALLSNHYVLSIDGAEVGQGDTAEVARRQPDGSWKYVIDNPYGHALPSG